MSARYCLLRRGDRRKHCLDACPCRQQFRADVGCDLHLLFQPAVDAFHPLGIYNPFISQVIYEPVQRLWRDAARCALVELALEEATQLAGEHVCVAIPRQRHDLPCDRKNDIAVHALVYRYYPDELPGQGTTRQDNAPMEVCSNSGTCARGLADDVRVCGVRQQCKGGVQPRASTRRCHRCIELMLDGRCDVTNKVEHAVVLLDTVDRMRNGLARKVLDIEIRPPAQVSG